MKTIRMAFTALLLLVWVASSAAYSLEYNIRYLHSLPGYSETIATATNNNGLIVGFARDENHDREPVWWDADGKMHALGISSNKLEGLVLAVNNQGWMLGRQYTGFDYYGQLTVWKPDGSIQVFPYGDGGAINNACAVAGAMGNQAAIYHPDGTTQMLPNIIQTADIMSSRVCGINNNGETVGICSYTIACVESVTTAVKWDRDGNLQRLNGLQAAGYANLYINDRGDVLDQRGHLILGDGTTRQLQLPVGESWGSTSSINNLGQVAGSTYQGTAMLWDENGIGTEIDTPEANQSFYLRSLNDNGIIAGSVYTRYQGEAAAVWEPVVPEPASLTTLLFGLSGFAGWGLKIRQRKNIDR